MAVKADLIKKYLKNNTVVLILGISIIIGVLLVGFIFFDTLEITNGNTSQQTPTVFGATYMTLNNPYFRVLNDSIKEVIEANGDILITRDAVQDPDRQIRQIREMIKENVKVIFLNPVDSGKISVALEECQKAGVVVINVDTLVAEDEYVVSAIESDNYNAGVLCAEDMMKKKSSAKIVMLDSPGTDAIVKRVRGFKDSIKEFPQYEIVYRQSGRAELEVSMDVMSRILNMRIEFDVVFCGNDPTALGALAALQQKRMTDNVLIYGVDGSPDVKSMIKDGEIEGTAAQSPKILGSIAAETAYLYLSGEPIEKHIQIPGPLITKENLHKFEIDEWQ